MVRGWQRRVEIAGARRVESKQRKQKQNNRSNYKTLVQSLLAFLEQHSQMIERRADPTWKLHIWTDIIPSDSAPLFEMDEEQDTKGKRHGRSFLPSVDPKRKGKARSESIGEYPASAKQKSQEAGQSGSFRETSCIANKHSQTRKEIEGLDQGDKSLIAPVLCKNQFFTGKCDDLKAGKKGRCRCFHYPKQSKTLADVLKASEKNDTSDVQETLEISAQSLLQAMQDEGADIYEAGGMEMLYYSSVDLVIVSPERSGDNDNTPTANEILSKAMGERSIAAANVVYVTINNILVFDRYRDGVIISDQTMMTAVLADKGRRSRSTSLALSLDGEGKDECRERLLENSLLPVQILEYILTFLPDQCVATMSRVCHAWNAEIESSSPELWRHMLQRRGWPIAHDIDDFDELREQLRSDFLLHYTVVRDMLAVKDALVVLLDGGKKAAIGETEMVFQAFSTRRTAPQESNNCVATAVWSSSQILVAYAHDCTLRLFNAVDKSLEGGSPRSCRELVCICIDPFRKTKKHTTTLIDMGLSQDRIGCLCQIQACTGMSESYILAVITRDDYLSSDGNNHNDILGSADLEDGVLKVIDLGEAVRNYVISLDESEGQLSRLSDYLTEGGELTDVEVHVEPRLLACGYDRFLLEVSISIPDDDTPDDENDNDDVLRRMVVVGRKLVLICAAQGLIVWMGDSVSSEQSVLRREDMLSMACLKSTRGGVGRNACFFVATSASSPVIMHAVVDITGYVQPVQFIDAAEIFWSELNANGLDAEAASAGSTRPIVMTDTDIVVAYCLRLQMETENPQFKSFVSFYPRLTEVISYQAIQLDGNCEVVGMQQLRDHHVVIFCKIGTTTNVGFDGGFDEGNGIMPFEVEVEYQFCIILMHVPTRQEIHRIFVLAGDSLLYGIFPLHHTPFCFAADGNTIGVGVSWKGVIITGSTVRELGEHYGLGDGLLVKLNRKRNKKSNRKRNIKSKAKQDGFARGMSMQG